MIRILKYNEEPIPILDNVQYNLPFSDLSKYLGYIELNTPLDLGDNLVSITYCSFQDTLASNSTSLYGILQTNKGYAPNPNIIKVIDLKIRII